MIRDDRGSTLVGELIALAIVGTALVALLSGLSTSSFGVRLVEHHVSAETVARNQMEAIKAAPYQPNPTAVPYPTVAVPPGYHLDIEVSYWVTATHTFAPALPDTDGGLQRIRVAVHSLSDPDSTAFSLEGYKGNRP
ncbi:MAG TPA: type II secretion system protein [Chloroflexi bacterium]|jgi:type II secretory pathway pseudopilin PulG|nr:type II secretion system protein [Chloroflexota bacterium]